MKTRLRGIKSVNLNVFQSALAETFSPVYLVAPAQIMTWLNQYHHHCEELLHHITYVDTHTDDLTLHTWCVCFVLFEDL